MSNYTKKLIIETFERLLERMPFEKITVTALIRECNIGRNTFYYHYKDIYALLDDVLAQALGQYKDAVKEESWQDVLKSLLYACLANKKKIYHLFDSLSRDRLAHYVFDRTDSAISGYVRRYAEERNADPEHTEIVSEIVKYSIYGYFMRFLWNGMQSNIEESVTKLGEVFDELLNNMIH